MRMNTEQTTIERSGTFEQGAFKINASAHAFKILSSGLYSDKITAVIRELCCNALDGHIKAGKKDVPFLVKLPTSFDPEFIVEDYGTGLSHDLMMHLYTTYFLSDKNDTDDLIGGLGLGSKSPFALTDSFTVISRQNGERRSYTAYLSEDGTPALALMSTEYTDEPNGLTVAVPVPSSETYGWRERAEKLLGRFPTLPTVKGVGTFEPRVPEYVVEGDGWAVRKSSGYSYRPQGKAVMGVVAYTLDAESMQKAGADVLAVMRMPIDIHFEIGEVEVAPSREGLSYTKRTQAAIIDRIAKIKEEMAEKYADAMSDCKTLWEAKIKYQEIMRDLPDGARQLIKASLKFDGELIGNQHIDATVPDGYFLRGNRFYHIEREKFSNKRLSLIHEGHVRIIPRPELKVYWDDKSVKGVARRIHEGSPSVDTYVISTDDPTVRDEMLERMGNPEWTPITDLPEPPKMVRTSSGSVYRPVAKLQRIVGFSELTTRHGVRPILSDEDRDVSLGGIYVPLYASMPMRGDREDTDALKWIMQDARDLGLLSEPVFGIPATHKNIPVKHKGWENVYDVVTKRFAKYLKENNVSQKMADFKSYDRLDYRMRGILDRISRLNWEPKRPRKPFGKLLTAAKSAVVNMHQVSRLSTHLEVPIKEVKSKYNYLEMLKECADNYPLIFEEVTNPYGGGRHNLNEEAVADYVNLMDTRRK